MRSPNPHAARRRSCLRAGCLLLALILSAPVQAQDIADKLRAAFLYNFAKFVTWPPHRLPAPDTSVRLCVLQDPDFAELLTRTVAGKQVSGHPLEVVHAAAPAALGNCHVAYFPELNPAAEVAMALLQQQNVLTVHQAEQAKDAGVVRFFVQDRKIRLEINSTAADSAQLKISAKLLSLAQVVQG